RGCSAAGLGTTPSESLGGWVLPPSSPNGRRRDSRGPSGVGAGGRGAATRRVGGAARRSSARRLHVGVRVGGGASATHGRAGAPGGHGSAGPATCWGLLRGAAQPDRMRHRRLPSRDAAFLATLSLPVVRLRGAPAGVGVMRVAALVPAYQAAPWLGDVLLGLQALTPAPDVLV